MMSGFKFDPFQPGLRKTLREYEELVLRCARRGRTRETWRHVNEILVEGDTISSARISMHVLGSEDFIPTSP